MKRALRRGIPVALVAAATIAAGVLLATRPWDNGTGLQEAVATPAEFGVCNVSVRNVPEGVEAYHIAFPEGGILGAKWALVLRISGPAERRLSDKPDATGMRYMEDPDTSGITINAETGEVIHENYHSAEHEAKLNAALATLAVGPWEPRGPAWPRTDTAATGEVAEILRPVRTASDYGKVDLKYRQPETGSGMLAGPFTTGQQTYLKLETCLSDALIDVQGHVKKWEVAPEEEAMFQRFLEEVETADGSSVRMERGPS